MKNLKKRLCTILALALIFCCSVENVAASTNIIWQDRMDGCVNHGLYTFSDIKNGRYYNGYSFNRTFYRGDIIELDLESDEFDTYLNVYFCFENGERLVASNDDCRSGTNSHVTYRATAEGYVFVECTSSCKGETGNYYFYWNIIPN